MHPLLSRQELSYGIYLIEPVANITFNRGILLNAGFIESNKLSEDKWECHAYHDVDLLPEYDYAPYSCPEYPTHLSHIISSHGYKYKISKAKVKIGIIFNLKKGDVSAIFWRCFNNEKRALY